MACSIAIADGWLTGRKMTSTVMKRISCYDSQSPEA
jgi:hypothetical protein